MKNRLFLLIAILLAACFASMVRIDAHAFDSSARGMCVIEASSGRVLYAKDKDRQLPMASTTKIVTALTVLNNCSNLDEIITVADKSVGVPGTSIYLKKGEQISIRDLLYGLMLRSGNDAATALAIHVAGSIDRFAEMMSETARNCGAVNSCFANPHGLDMNNHYTTAYDLALISSKALENDLFREIVSTRNYQIPATNMCEIRYLHNKNRLLTSLDGCIGVKTGFTDDAGRCLVSAVERNDMRVVCVVLNCGPMFEDSTLLLESAYLDYHMQNVIEANTHIDNKSYFDDKNNMLYIYCKENIAYPIKDGESKYLQVKYNYYDRPKEYGEIGQVEVYFQNRLIKSAKLYTINSIEILQRKDILNSISVDWAE